MFAVFKIQVEIQNFLGFIGISVGVTESKSDKQSKEQL